MTVWSLSEKLLNHFRDPSNAGIIKNADGIGYLGDPSWGIEMELSIKVEDGIIIDARFRTFGCSASIATSSVITEMIKGKGIEEALNISSQAIDKALGGLPQYKEHYAALGQELITLAIEDYLTKKSKDGSK